VCHSNDPNGDAMCPSGDYCDGVMCHLKFGTGLACVRDGECAHGTCNGAPTGACN
jgi:hypothetical protein